MLRKWQQTRKIKMKSINKLFDRAESYVNLSSRPTTESIEIEASCILELLKNLEVINNKYDREIQKTFEATVHRRIDLTNIEKFTYL